MSAGAKSNVTAAVEVLVLPTGNRLHIAPPLNLSDEDAKAGLAILDEVLAVPDSHC